MNIINAVNTTEILILKWLLLCYLSFILLVAAPLHMAQRPTATLLSLTSLWVQGEYISQLFP